MTSPDEKREAREFWIGGQVIISTDDKMNCWAAHTHGEYGGIHVIEKIALDRAIAGLKTIATGIVSRETAHLAGYDSREGAKIILRELGES